jgi:hypothetical protein
MKSFSIVIILFSTLILSNVYAVETPSESKHAVKNDLKRETHKTIHRVKEATCLESDTECLKQKVKHRVEETKETIQDKANEVRNNVN